MKIAVEGCAHGELEIIYNCIETLQEREQIKIDLLICCGDFQAVRNNNDLCAMAVPEKYQNICSFYKYYSGEKQAPVLTIFIGGNHEASNYLQELPYGGWVAPNIYYMGRAGVVKFGNLRIGGLSGIFKNQDYLQGLWESPPYNRSSMRSVYHVRSLDVFRLKQMTEKVNVMLSHDWPRGIAQHGNSALLFKMKPFLRNEIESNTLGSKPAEELLNMLKPEYWFAAHMHFQFSALVPHDDQEIECETKFLALDKCLPKRRHLQILDIPDCDGDMCLKYDAEWLAILKNTNHLLTVRNVDCHMPGPGGLERYDFTPSEQEKAAIHDTMGSMIIDSNEFVRTEPAYTIGSPNGVPMDPISNPQTVKLCELLCIDDPLQVVLARSGRVLRQYKEHFKTPEISETSTPQKNARLSLPAPVTPICETELESIAQQSDTLYDSDMNNTTTLSNMTIDDTECCTPNVTEKRTFKRRNQALYTPGGDSTSSCSSKDDTDSPKSSKLQRPSF